MTESIKRKEIFPMDREVLSRIEAYLKEREYSEVRKLEDESGMYFLELKSVDNVGDEMFVYYKRAGNFGNNMFSNETVIEVTYTYEGTEMGGETVTRWEGGEWKDA